MTPTAFTLVTHVVRKGDGQGRVNLEVAKEAVRRGIEVVLVAREVDPALAGEKGVKWIRVGDLGVPSHLLREIVFSVRSAAAIRRHAKGPLLSNGCITSVAADVNACHFVHSAWMNSPVHSGRLLGGVRGAYQRSYTAYNARLERKAYAQAGRVVAVSEQVRGELAAIGIDADKICTVPNGVDSEEFVPGPADRTRFGLPSDARLALFAGDIRSPRKNLDTVLRALAQVPGLHLAVAGDLEGSPYPSMASELGIEDRTHFLGRVREMPLLMRSCDVFAFPSRYEACSLVMLEAMAAGLPVITSRRTGGAELVPPDGGFFLDDPDDVPGLTGILQGVVRDAEGLVRRSLRARERAIGLRWDAMGGKYLELLGEACAPGKGLRRG
jgi:glycosyltransferase involved in cell wall biosynthesis